MINTVVNDRTDLVWSIIGRQQNSGICANSVFILHLCQLSLWVVLPNDGKRIGCCKVAFRGSVWQWLNNLHVAYGSPNATAAPESVNVFNGTYTLTGVVSRRRAMIVSLPVSARVGIAAFSVMSVIVIVCVCSPVDCNTCVNRAYYGIRYICICDCELHRTCASFTIGANAKFEFTLLGYCKLHSHFTKTTLEWFKTDFVVDKYIRRFQTVRGSVHCDQLFLQPWSMLALWSLCVTKWI